MVGDGRRSGQRVQSLRREQTLTVAGRAQALTRLDHLRRHWHEVQPTDVLRDEAERRLAVHTLRAADALQLAAALTWCGHRTRGRCFIGADGELTKAAETEGFTVVCLM